ncbi:hypothetical protein C7M84_015409 [Penaeus vannamei]|uniref:Venom dipeptidyl peptidase 4 n=1 Tax=Penaeus vannamei TaxID=6689 RepID=A0A423SQW7_PENVA|nr:hypothetical protein C7M84_015409 [Penaeus vannamei]
MYLALNFGRGSKYPLRAALHDSASWAQRPRGHGRRRRDGRTYPCGGGGFLTLPPLTSPPARELVGLARPRVWRNLLLGTVGVMLIVAAAIGIVIPHAGRNSSGSVEENGSPIPLTSALTATPGGIDLAEVLNGTFSANSFNGTWISGEQRIPVPQRERRPQNVHRRDAVHEELVSQEIMVSAAPRGEPRLQCSRKVTAAFAFARPLPAAFAPADARELCRDALLCLLAEWRPFKYSLSPSRKFLLVVHDVQKESIPLAPQRVRSRNDQPPLLYATWAPTDDALAFVSHNDLYYTTGPDLATMYRLTDTGQIGSIFNGIPDWVYEEEILSSNSALWFGPNGLRLAFATFNDSRVDTMNFPLYGRPGDLSFQYPIHSPLNTQSPVDSTPCRPVVVDLAKLISGSSDTVTRLPPPATLSNVDHYFTHGGLGLARLRNVNILSICQAESGVCSDDLVHESPDKAWNDLYTPPMFDEANGDTYLIILPTFQGDRGHFKHINFRRSSDKTLTPLTTGTYEVVDILSWDRKNHIVYFTAAPSGRPGQRHIYYVGDLSSPQPKQAYCITCGFKNDFNEDCIPQVTLHRASDHSRLRLIEDNQEVRERLLDRSLPLEKRLEIDVAGGFKAQVSMKLPPDYNPTRFQSYPMLVYVYGGPGSQLVSDRFRIDWGDYLASERGIIYASIDGRGSGYSGDKLLHSLYYGLGTAEVDDQIAVTSALQKSFPFIDSSRTAIWGWSYGGYVTAAALSKDSYPDENHGLAGVKRHHYHSMEDFLNDCFNKA